MSVVTCSNEEGEMKTGLDKGAQTLPHPKAVHLVPLSTPQLQPIVAMRGSVTRHSGFSSEDRNLYFYLKIGQYLKIGNVWSIKTTATAKNMSLSHVSLAGSLSAFRS